MAPRIGAYLYDTIWLLLRPLLWVDIIILVFVLAAEIFAMPGVALMQIPSETPLRDTWREALTMNPDVKSFFLHRYLRLMTPDDELIIPVWVLVCVLSLATGHRALQRAIRSLMVLRTLRVITYLVTHLCLKSTILPPARPGCTQHRFGHWISMGVQPFSQRFFELVWQQLKQNGPPFGGGCKDLLFSGHFVMLMLIGLCFHTVLFSRGWLPRIFVMGYHFMLFQKTMRAIIEGHHYSVDMLVAFYVTLLVWFLPVISQPTGEMERYPKWATATPTILPASHMKQL